MILRISIGAFLNSKETVETVEALKEDRLLFRSTIDVREGGISGAVSYLADKQTPQLLIVETSSQGDRIFEELDALANVCDPETRVILIGGHNDIGLFRALIQAGISDYLITPLGGDELRVSINKIFEGADPGASGRVIAFAGMTGGAGSSVIAQNVAHELTVAYDEQVIIVDLDLSYGTAALTYNMQPRQTIVDALSQTDHLDAGLLNQFFMDFGESKLSVLASPSSLSIGMTITPDSLDLLVRVLKPMAEFIVLDVPHLWEPWVNDVIAGADDLILMCRPDLTNLRNAKNVVEYLGPKRGVDYPTRVVLNQVGAAKRADLSNKDFKDALALAPSLSIPYDPEAFGRALNNGEMMSKASPKSKATRAIIGLAKMVSGREAIAEEGKKMGFSLFKKGAKK